jgi:hypothetical protein
MNSAWTYMFAALQIPLNYMFEFISLSAKQPLNAEFAELYGVSLCFAV